MTRRDGFIGCKLVACIRQIERAIRRTRRSTLERIVAALVKAKPNLGDPAALLDRLSRLAGIGLAPESKYRERVEKRRRARNVKLRRGVRFRYVGLRGRS
jgi:hypothetical protein